MEHADSVSPSEIKELLLQRRGDWPTICKHVDVSHSWISNFVRGRVPNPYYRILYDLKVYFRQSSTRGEVSPSDPQCRETG